MKASIWILLVFIVPLFAMQPPADAGESPTPPSSPTQGGTSAGSIWAAATSPYSGQRKWPRYKCSWDAFNNQVAGFEAANPGLNTEYKIVRRYNCSNASVADAWLRVSLAPAEQLFLPALQDYVVSQLPLPEPEITPLREQGWILVQIPMDFRVTPETWQPIVASASIEAGPLSRFSTLTATPSRLEMIPNDGRNPADRASCDGDEAIAPYEPETPGACSYTYRSSSATAPNGLEFPAEFLIHWDVTYITSDQPGVRTLTIDPTVTQRPIGVAEVKGFVTCVGSTCAE